MIPSHWLRRAVALACALAALGLVAGCGGSSSSGGAGEAKLLKVGTVNPVDSLNPFVGVSQLAVELTHQYYPFLTEWDQGAKLGPGLAKSWTFSNGFKTLTLKLNTGGRWSDGKPLTAADAAFTLNSVVRYGRGSAAFLFGYVQTLKSASAPDAGTLVVNFASSTPQAPAQLAAVPILPQHVWSQYASGDGRGLQKFQNNAPVVSGGPFTLQSYQPKQFVRLVRNDGFYGDRPHLEELGYQFYSSPDALVQAIKSGEIDAAEQAPPSATSALRAARLVIQDPVSFSELWLMINDSSKTPTHPELHNRTVRQAIDLAVDRDRIVQTAYYGQAEAGSSILPPSNGAYHLDATPTAFDIAQANSLLDQAGFKRGSNGIRQANGHAMEYKLIEFRTSGGAEDPASQILKENFAKIGIKLDISLLDIPAAIAALMGPKQDYSTFDMAIVTFVGSYDPTNVLGALTCQALPTFNATGHCDRAFDAGVIGLGSKPDGQARIDAVHRLQQDIADDGSPLTLAYSKDVYVYQPGWTGFIASPQGWFWNTETSTHVGKAK